MLFPARALFQRVIDAPGPWGMRGDVCRRASAGADRAGGLFLLLPCFFSGWTVPAAACPGGGAGALGAFRRDPGADRLPDGVPGLRKRCPAGLLCILCKVQENYFNATFFICLLPRLGVPGGVLRVFVLLSIKTRKKGVFGALAGCFFVAVVAICTKKAG